VRRLFQKLHFKSLNHTEISSHKKRSYRPDIDGLRAVAVISVVCFHAHFKFFGIEPFRGGYVGVDIFFVISGYLITGIILRELTNGEFSLARFYERRARRILPALLLIVLTMHSHGTLCHDARSIQRVYAERLFCRNLFGKCFLLETGRLLLRA
jgi:hypothetical protein